MIAAKVQIKHTSAETLFCHPLPKGASGLKVAFEFNDPFWSTLSKTAVFRNHVKTIDAIVTDDCAIIPHELLTEVGKPVHVGIYGTDMQSNLAVPIIWATLGDVCSASNPSGESSAEPTLPYWAQIQEQVNTLQKEMMSQEDLENALLQAKESGTFDGPQGPKGEQGEPGIPGTAGKDGYTPIAGKDYWTQEEKNEITSNAAYMAAENVRLYSDIVCSATGSTIILEDASGRTLHTLRIHGKTKQNGTPTPEAPVPLESVGDSGSVSVTVCGKNLFDGKNVGYIDINSGKLVTYEIYRTTDFIPMTEAIYGFHTEGMFNVGKLNIAFYDSEKNYIGYGLVNVDGFATFTRKYENAVFMRAVCLLEYIGVTYLYENCPAASEYEPYNGGTVTVSTPNGLPGIPVTSGGNYTDENGQQWICDEVDFEKGVYVQRVGIKIFDGTETFAMRTSGVGNNYLSCSVSDIKPAKANNVLTGAICSHLQEKTTDGLWDNEDIGFSLIGGVNEIRFRLPGVSSVSEVQTLISAWKNGESPLKVVYELAEEKRIPLTTGEMAQYAALHTNYPNTTIFNDGGAGMEVKYVADTKSYIDRKFSLLVTSSNNI